MKRIDMEEEFDALMSHLNSEDNDMAAEFRAKLSTLVRIVDEEWMDAGSKLAREHHA